MTIKGQKINRPAYRTLWQQARDEAEFQRKEVDIWRKGWTEGQDQLAAVGHSRLVWQVATAVEAALLIVLLLTR